MEKRPNEKCDEDVARLLAAPTLCHSRLSIARPRHSPNIESVRGANGTILAV